MTEKENIYSHEESEKEISILKQYLDEIRSSLEWYKDAQLLIYTQQGYYLLKKYSEWVLFYTEERNQKNNKKQQKYLYIFVENWIMKSSELKSPPKEEKSHKDLLANKKITRITPQHATIFIWFAKNAIATMKKSKKPEKPEWLI